MNTIGVRICQRRADLLCSSIIVCGNSDYTVTFVFDSEWDDYTEKAACFAYCRNGARITENVPFTGNTCAVPVLHDIDAVEIGVFAGNIRTTSPARITCIRCSTDLHGEPYHPPADVYDQLMELVAIAENPAPPLPFGYCYIIASDGSYIITAEGDYIIAKE